MNRIKIVNEQGAPMPPIITSGSRIGLGPFTSVYAGKKMLFLRTFNSIVDVNNVNLTWSLDSSWIDVRPVEIEITVREVANNG